MRLNEIQTRFKGMMLAPETDDALADILETSDIPLTRRMDVYRNNVMSGLGNALSANFPLLEKLVGRDFLSSMVRAYIVAHPPTSGCLTFMDMISISLLQIFRLLHICLTWQTWQNWKFSATSPITRRTMRR